MQNLWQQSHSVVAQYEGKSKKPTPEQIELGRKRKRAERRTHARYLSKLLSQNADLSEWEQMADELETN